MKEGGRQKARGKSRKAAPSVGSRSLFTALPPALCLCILALRVTYTEAPTAPTMALAGSLTDTVYSLTLSGLLVFAFVGWIVYRFMSGLPAYRITGIEIGLVLFGAATLISSIGASDKRAALNQSAILLAPILAALLLAQVLDSADKVRIVLAVIVALGVVSAYQCAEQFFMSNTITIEQYEKDPNMLLGPLGIEPGTFQHFLFEHRLYSRGIRGFFTTSNSAASYGICASFAAVALLIGKLQVSGNRKERLRYTGFALAALVFVVAGLLLTQSKGGILAFFAGLVVFALLVAANRWFGVYRRHLVLAFLSTGALLVLLAGFLAVRYGLSNGRLPGGNSMLVRWQYWVATAQMYADHPVAGVGPGNFSDYYPHYKPASALESVADPHNWPLSLLAQWGPLGLIGFLTMLCLPLWQAVTKVPGNPSVPDASRQPAYRTPALMILFALGLCLLFVRPLLIPTSGSGDFDIRLYEIVTLFIAPAAAFLIGFLLVATPFEPVQSASTDTARSAVSASLIAAILAVLLHNLIDFAIFEPGVWMAFWILLACLISRESRNEQPVQVPSRSRPPKLKWLAGGVALAIVLAYVAWIWMPVCRSTMGIHKAQRAASHGRFDLAHHALEIATRADRLSPFAAGYDGRLYLQQYEQVPQKSTLLLDDAIRCFREAIARSPADYKNYEKLASAHAQAGRHQEAYDWYLGAARLYPGSERLQFELGQLAERLGRPDAAIEHYARATQIDAAYREQFRKMYPDRPESVSRLGESDYRLVQERIEKLRGEQAP